MTVTNNVFAPATPLPDTTIIQATCRTVRRVSSVISPICYALFGSAVITQTQPTNNAQCILYLF